LCTTYVDTYSDEYELVLRHTGNEENGQFHQHVGLVEGIYLGSIEADKKPSVGSPRSARDGLCDNDSGAAPRNIESKILFLLVLKLGKPYRNAFVC